MKHSIPLVSIIIVNWNGKRWLRGCLSSLSKARYRNTEWIIVDNASTDGSVRWVKKYYPKAIVIQNSENIGFSHANNLGYKRARGKYVLFLNNDTKVKPGFLREFLKPFQKDTRIGGAQSKILLMDDHTRLDSIGAFLTPTGFLLHNHLAGKDKKELDKQIDLYTVKGAAMMFRKDVLKKVEVNGWIFDPRYFAYFEESDLCHRIWLAGYRIVYAYHAVIYHKMGATSNTLVSSRVQFNSYKNRINSYIKNFGLTNLLYVLPQHIAICNVLGFVFLFHRNHQWFFAIHKAIWWNILHLVQTLQARAIVQNTIRKRPDSAFFPVIMKFPQTGYYTGFLSMFLRIYRH